MERRVSGSRDDARGGIGTTSFTINVGGVNQPPIANASATPTSGSAPLTVQFSSAGSSDPDGTIVEYQWTFGDAFGTFSSEPNPTYTYGYAGTYPATLTVWDNNNIKFNTSGNRGTYTLTVNNITKSGFTFDSAGSVLTKSITK